MTSLWNVGCTLSLALLNNGKESKIISASQLFTFSPSGKAWKFVRWYLHHRAKMQKSLHWSVCRDGFREKAVPASHKTALECSGIILMPGVVTWNDRNTLSEVRDKRCRPPRLEIRKGPFCQDFRRPVFFNWLPCKFREQKTFLLFLDSKHVSKPASYLQIYIFRNSQMEAHLKNMRL